VRPTRTAGGLISLAVVAGLGLAAQPGATAQPAQQPPTGANEPTAATPSDALANPISDKQTELRQQAWADVLSGDARTRTVNGNRVVRTGRENAPARTNGRAGAQTTQDQYVELENERTDRVFVFLVEFGDERHPEFPDADVDPATAGPAEYDGPGFNHIPQPGPDDNSTQWRPKFDKKYYKNLYFGEGEGVESLKTYYERQSSGRYSVSGEVTDITRVQYNQARYGRPFEGEFAGAGCTLTDIVCSNTWELIRDGMTQWVADQKAAGKTDAQIKKRLATYDKLDRYDFDGDGNFDEPDGYLDRFQIIHAGGDQADGDPQYGEDAIWSHRWYAYYTDQGKTGPADNPLGGTQIGDTGLWVGDYTIQPENGGLSVVAHEYGHDLGLPDHYDTAASGDNPVSWWTLMAQSRVSDAGDQGIGTRAADLGVWDKLQLGWLDYETVVAGKQRTLDLGPHEYNSANPQGVAVVLPDKQVATTLPTPPEGTKQWWSGAGNSYAASMSRQVAVPAAGGTLSMKLAWNIEEDFDYAYVEVQAPGGQWTALNTAAIDPDPGNQADEPGIDGVQKTYVPASFDLAPYAGQTIGLRVRYATDGAAQGQDPSVPWSGVVVDDVKVTSGGTTVFADGAETPPGGWTLSGFRSVAASFTTAYDHFYLASNRAYVSYDKYLRTGPYNFGYPDRPDFAEHFPYQDGLLVNYWDTSFSDNNTSQHPGGGLVLPVDANPEVDYNLEGQAWRGRIQNYDAPFSTQKYDSFTLHVNGKASYVRGGPANPVFDDSDPNRYFQPFVDGGLPRVGVRVAGAGVKIRVVRQDGTSMRIRIS
jgi:immune inhibitor A